MNAMKKQCCGDPDVEEEASRFKRYESVASWSKTEFTYYIEYSSQNLSAGESAEYHRSSFPKMVRCLQCRVLPQFSMMSPKVAILDHSYTKFTLMICPIASVQPLRECSLTTQI